MKVLSVLLLLAVGLGAGWWRITHPDGTLADARLEAEALGSRLRAGALAARDGARGALVPSADPSTIVGTDTSDTSAGSPATNPPLASGLDGASGPGAAGAPADGAEEPLVVDPAVDPLAAVASAKATVADGGTDLIARVVALESRLSSTRPLSDTSDPPTIASTNVLRGRLTDAERRLDASAVRESATLEQLATIDARLGRIAERLEASAIESTRRHDATDGRLKRIDAVLATLESRAVNVTDRLDTLGAARLDAAAGSGQPATVPADAPAPADPENRFVPEGALPVEGADDEADDEGDDGADTVVGTDAVTGSGADALAAVDTAADEDTDALADVDAATDAGASDGAGPGIVDPRMTARLDTMASGLDRRLAAMERRLTADETTATRLEELARRVEDLAATRSPDGAASGSPTVGAALAETPAGGASIDAAQAKIRTELVTIGEQLGEETTSDDAPVLGEALESTRERLDALEARVLALPAASDAAEEANATQDALDGQVEALERRLEALPKGTEPAAVSSIGDVRDRLDAPGSREFVTEEELREITAGRNVEYKIYFDRNSTTIGPDAARVLDSFVAQEQNRTTGVSIFGFTDPRGSASYNQRLALERATNVRSYLIRNGLPYTKIRAMNGLGDDAAAAILPDQAEDAQQRVVVLYAAQP